MKSCGENEENGRQHKTVVDKRPQPGRGLAEQTQELRKGERGIQRLGLQDWCHVFPVLECEGHVSRWWKRVRFVIPTSIYRVCDLLF